MTYNRCKNERVGLLPFDIPEVCGAIKNGTPLPKGHGKIGDLDKLIKRVTNLPKCPNGHSKMYDEAMIINIIDNESVIIEAESEEE